MELDGTAPVKIGIITVSDRASEGKYEDLSGPAIIDTLNDYLITPWEPIHQTIPDEQYLIESTLKQMAPRDVTPEATETVCDKMMPGFGELMRQVSLQYVPTAILSRQTAGIRGSSLIINLPGKPKSIRECLDAVFPAVPYCIDLINGPYLKTKEEVIKVFRPKA